MEARRAETWQRQGLVHDSRYPQGHALTESPGSLASRKHDQGLHVVPHFLMHRKEKTGPETGLVTRYSRASNRYRRRDMRVRIVAHYLEIFELVVVDGGRLT